MADGLSLRMAFWSLGLSARAAVAVHSACGSRRASVEGSLVVVCVVGCWVTSIASTVGVAVDAPAVFASGSGDEASVPAQPLAEPQMNALASPVWPAASADLSSLSAGELTSGAASGGAARSADAPAAVVSVGPAAALATGPIQAGTVQGQALSVMVLARYV